MRSDTGGTGRDSGAAFRCDGLRGGDGAHLAGITGVEVSLNLRDKGITGLKAGDSPADRTVLHVLDKNELTALPAGLFDGLAALNSLYFGNNPLTRPAAEDIRWLAGITGFVSQRHRSCELPAGLFDDVPKVSQLDINNAELAALPDGISSR